MLKLVVINGPRKGRQVRVSDGAPVTVGRDQGRLRLHDSRVSKRHAEIVFDGESWVLRDLGSSNGTYLNKQRLQGLAELERGDVLQFGRIVLRVRQADGWGMRGDRGQDGGSGAGIGVTAPATFEPTESVIDEVTEAAPVSRAGSDDDLDLDALFEEADEAEGHAANIDADDVANDVANDDGTIERPSAAASVLDQGDGVIKPHAADLTAEDAGPLDAISIEEGPESADVSEGSGSGVLIESGVFEPVPGEAGWQSGESAEAKPDAELLTDNTDGLVNSSDPPAIPPAMHASESAEAAPAEVEDGQADASVAGQGIPGDVDADPTITPPEQEADTHSDTEPTEQVGTGTADQVLIEDDLSDSGKSLGTTHVLPSETLAAAAGGDRSAALADETNADALGDTGIDEDAIGLAEDAPPRSVFDHVTTEPAGPDSATPLEETAYENDDDLIRIGDDEPVPPTTTDNRDDARPHTDSAVADVLPMPADVLPDTGPDVDVDEPSTGTLTEAESEGDTPIAETGNGTDAIEEADAPTDREVSHAIEAGPETIDADTVEPAEEIDAQLGPVTNSEAGADLSSAEGISSDIGEVAVDEPVESVTPEPGSIAMGDDSSDPETDRTASSEGATEDDVYAKSDSYEYEAPLHALAEPDLGDWLDEEDLPVEAGDEGDTATAAQAEPQAFSEPEVEEEPEVEGEPELSDTVEPAGQIAGHETDATPDDALDTTSASGREQDHVAEPAADAEASDAPADDMSGASPSTDTAEPDLHVIQEDDTVPTASDPGATDYDAPLTTPLDLAPGSASAIAEELDRDDEQERAALTRPADDEAVDSRPPAPANTPTSADINPTTVRPPQEPRPSYRSGPTRRGRGSLVKRLAVAAGVFVVLAVGVGLYLGIIDADAIVGRFSPNTPADPEPRNLPNQPNGNSPDRIPRNTGQPGLPPELASPDRYNPSPPPYVAGAPSVPDLFANNSRVLGAQALVGRTTDDPNAVRPGRVNPGDTQTGPRTGIIPIPPLVIPNPGGSTTPGIGEPETPTQPDTPAVTDGTDDPATDPIAPTDGDRLVFLVDCSGSLVDSLPRMLHWLREAIDTLGPGETFTIIFFKKDQAIETEPVGLQPLTRAYQRRLNADWLDPNNAPVFPTGRSDPAAALALALSYNPSDIYLLSDDAFAQRTGDTTPQQAGELVANTLGSAEVRVHGVQFFYDAGDSALQAIAEQFGGTYEFVAETRHPDQDPIDLLEELENRNNE